MALYSNSYYPQYGVDELRSRYGVRWADLVNLVNSLPKTDARVIAFTVTMRRLSKSLHLPERLMIDAFNAISINIVLRLFGRSEDDVLAMYRANLDEVIAASASMRRRPDMVARRASFQARAS